MTRPILLIDDEPSYRESIVDLFDGTDYRVVEASSPTEAGAKLDGDPRLQVVLLDLSFKGVSGVTVLKHISSRSSNYRVIVLTAHDELLLAEEASQYDVFHYLPKSGELSAQSIRFSVAQAFKDLDHAQLARKTDSLLRAQEKITRNDAIEETLDFICASIRSVVGAYTCHIRVYDFKGGDYHVRGFAGPDQEVRALFARPKAKRDDFSGEVVRKRQAHQYQDLQGHPDFLKFKAEALSRPWESTKLHNQVRAYFDRAASAYVAPISTGLYGDLVDAVLTVSSDQPHYFKKAEQNLVDEFVSQAALAITKDWLQKKRIETHEDYGAISSMLAAMSQAARGPEPLKEVYNVVTEQIARIVGAEIVSIFEHDDATGLLRNVVEIRAGQTIEEPDEQYRCGRSLTGRVVADDATIHLPPPDDPNPQSPAEDTRFDKIDEKAFLQLIPSGELKHYLGVPIRVGGRVHGVLRAINKKSQYYDEGPPIENPRCLLERGFSRDCRNTLEIAANHLAAAIHNVELLEEKDRQVDQIRTLGEVGRLISSETDIKEVLDITIRKMHELMQAGICMLYLKDKQTGRLVLQHAFGAPEDESSDAVREVAAVVTSEVETFREPRLIDSTATGRAGAMTSLMAVPIRARGHLVGVMTVINKAGGDQEYDSNDLELFQTFADYVGVAIENAQIYKLTNERLAIAERSSALSLLVSAVAHEINNTSGVIPLTVDALREYLRPAGNEEINLMLDVIDDAAHQASDFANELAGFSANRIGRQKALDVNRVIGEAVRVLWSQYGKSTGTRVELSLADTPLVCEIFRNPFIQIVRNIVINSIQALDGKEGGVIRVSTMNGNGLAEMRFADNGPGIRPEYYDKIFEPEFTTKPKGNGLGLWLTRIQLEAVGGTIEVDREMKQGAAFIVRIPLSTNPEFADEYDPSPDRR